MKKQSKEFFREVKKQADKAVDEVKQYAVDTKEKVELYQAFKKESVKMKKVTSEFINLDMPIYGILDKNMESMTFRAKDSLEVNQILQVGKTTVKVEYIHNEAVQVPVVINGIEHQVECKVAVLKKL
ncbi:MAG: hypothetical protein Q7I99_03655 [Acholeplasmataceae bacterium]|nr:hypothetical protein [Acholeplasmataceae bacterium]